jgi:hypothetical protein
MSIGLEKGAPSAELSRASGKSWPSVELKQSVKQFDGFRGKQCCKITVS